jgi:hypothetical protein
MKRRALLAAALPALGFAIGLAAGPGHAAERLPPRILASLGRTPRYLFVGEIHGTEQAAPVFAQIVQEYIDARQPVIVALELPPTEDDLVNTFLNAPDREVADARRDMLAAPFWKRAARQNDGRASMAMLQLLEHLRTVRLAEGTLFVRLVCVQSRDDAAAARLLQAAVEKYQGASVVSLSGNAHAMKQAATPAAAMPGYFPPKETFTIDVRTNGGQAWQCRAPGSCGQRVVAKPVAAEALCDRCLIMGDGIDNFDAIYSIATPATASRPVSDFHGGG